MTNNEILDRIIKNAFRLSHLAIYYEKMMDNKQLDFEQEQKLEVYFRIKRNQEELLGKLKRINGVMV